ncbi:hypothetical protein [Geodermatophilus ruber]|uniref:Uncharacterized protein n=1 Tax=Geodermatophilus ruber TaxID=504800 RepID=A0A1I3YGC5_9ACTN|nr:hypothetical protein [Geodermatophilus ruber]SFK30409.1 hypothetical protein SAMN04488085_1014 [Geodermatophilus ruber]
MTVAGQEGSPQGVRVLRPVAVRQVSAGLAVAAALAGTLALGLSLSTVRSAEEGATESIVRVAGGEVLTGYDGSDPWAWPSLVWTGPVTSAVLLLTAAALAALLGARADLPGRWATAAQLLALAGGGLLAGVTGVQVAVGSADFALGVAQEEFATWWGPVPGAAGAGALLAVAAALTARRGRAAVLATVGMRPAPAGVPADVPWGAR